VIVQPRQRGFRDGRIGVVARDDRANARARGFEALRRDERNLVRRLAAASAEADGGER
jgi:hypothetical protein